MSPSAKRHKRVYGEGCRARGKRLKGKPCQRVTPCGWQDQKFVHTPAPIYVYDIRYDASMPTDPDYRDAKQRALIQACLRTCELVHWTKVLWPWLEHYEGLKDLVEDERHAPLAAVLSLVRSMTRLEARPSDTSFSALLAELPFLDYRVRRSADPVRFCYEDGETWDPTTVGLTQWAAGRPVGAWRHVRTDAEVAQTARDLLSELRHGRDRHD